jgi:hypothetical protein
MERRHIDLNAWWVAYKSAPAVTAAACRAHRPPFVADESALLAELRDVLHELCGDVGLGAALASMQGA